MLMKYIKKPEEVDVVLWDGGNISEMQNFLGDAGTVVIDRVYICNSTGLVAVDVGNVIIKDAEGEFSSCTREELLARYYYKQGYIDPVIG